MELPHILLTPTTLELWGQFLLTSLLLTVVIYWQIRSRHHVSERTHYLALALTLHTVNVALLALRAGALHSEWMFWNIPIYPIAALSVFAVSKFIYRLPTLPAAWQREERIFSLVLGAVALGEVGYAGYRAWEMTRGHLHYRPWYLDWVLLLVAIWITSVLMRQAIRPDVVHAARTTHAATVAEIRVLDAKATHAFLVPMAFLLALAAVNMLQAPIHAPLTLITYLLSLLSMAMLVAVTLIYMNYYAPATSFVVQTTSVMIMLIILVVTTAGRAVTNVVMDAGDDAMMGAPATVIHFRPSGSSYAIAMTAPRAAPRAASTAVQLLTPQPDAAGMARVDLPFPFVFFGRPWSTIYVHPAGFLTLGAPQTLIDLEFRYGATPAIFALYPAGDEAPAQTIAPLRMTVATSAREVKIEWSDQVVANNRAGRAAAQVWLSADGAFTIAHKSITTLTPVGAGVASPATWRHWVGAHNGDITQAPSLVIWSELVGTRVAMTQTLVADSEFGVRKIIHPILAQLLVLMLVSVLTAVGAIPLFLRFGFMQPLERLLVGIQRMRRGDLTVQIPIFQQSELGEITETFNQLVANQRLLLTNLEEQVRQRTHSLATTNQQLHHALGLYQQTQRDLEQLNRQLDARVQARTHELTQSEARFRRVISSISDHVYAFTLNPVTGKLTLDFLSPNLDSFTGGDTDNFWEKWRAQVVMPDDLPLYDQHIADLFAGRNSQVEYRLQPRDDRPQWIHASVRCERFTATEIRCYGVMSDISARKQLDQEVAARRAAQEMEVLRSEWLGNMSHELRTPLGLIKTAVTTLLAEDIEIPPATQHSILVRLNQETNRLTDLVATLLDLSRLETARLTLHYAETDIGAMLQEVLDGVKLQMQLGSTPPFMVKLELATSEICAIVDRERMKRVVQNLLSNAMKFSPSHSPITISAAIECAHLVITVEDHGIGINEADHGRIFERYYQVKQPGMHGHSGVGLGLPICREIVNAHNGEISLTSRPASLYHDSGTTFVVRVPVNPSQRETS